MHFLFLILLSLIHAIDVNVMPPIRAEIAASVDPYTFLYSTFPPIDDIVIQTFHFTTSSPLILDLHDQFCTGNQYAVYDNGALIGSGDDILNYCGISANTLKPIISPTFTHVQFPLDAGEHLLEVIIFHSPIGNNKTSMMITLMPIGDEECLVSISKMDQKAFPYPHANYDPKEFNLSDFIH